jgi:hypothetical protein
MKIRNAIMAVLFLIALGVSSCAALNPPMTAEEEEEYCKIQKERFPEQSLRECGGDND